MSLELTALRMFKRREVFERLHRSIPARALEQRTAAILALFGQYFAEHEQVMTIKAEPFSLWFKLARPKLPENEHAIYANLFRQFDADNDPAIESGIMERLAASAHAAKVADLLEKYNDGADIDLLSAMAQLQIEFESTLNRKAVSLQELTPIEDILADEENEVGFRFRLNAISSVVKPLRGGDFMILAARPDAGKTTAVASEVTHMAAQVDQLYPGEDRSILWLCNEGPTKQIVYRTFQAALGATDEEMFKLAKQPDDRWRSKLRAKYVEAIGGRPGVLRVFPIHDKWSHEIEDIFKAYRPALVVFDMIDNVRFGGEVANMGQRTDQVLEAMYQWARMLAVKHDCAVIATSQISADGENMQWPMQSMLKDSKTGKQGAADVILMMGRIAENPGSRYLSTPKNKRKRTGVPSDLRAEVIFDPDHARLRDVEAT